MNSQYPSQRSLPRKQHIRDCLRKSADDYSQLPSRYLIDQQQRLAAEEEKGKTQEAGASVDKDAGQESSEVAGDGQDLQFSAGLEQGLETAGETTAGLGAAAALAKIAGTGTSESVLNPT